MTSQNNAGNNHFATDKPVAIAKQVRTQVMSLFPFGDPITIAALTRHIESIIPDIEYCFSHINDKYYRDDDGIVFDILNSDHYANFLYRLAHHIYKETNSINIPTRLYLLNKALHSVDIFYEVELPKIFVLNHPVGTVIGRAKYSDYLFISQCVTIGSNRGIYPTIGKYATFYPRATLLGSSRLGNNCAIAACGLCIDTDLKDDTVYYGTPKLFSTKIVKRTHKLWKNTEEQQDPIAIANDTRMCTIGLYLW
jgi:serine O-acetyltransferase